MTTPKQQRTSKAPPSRRALHSAYELILTQIWPRLPAATESTCRRIEHEDQTRTKRNHH